MNDSRNGHGHVTDTPDYAAAQTVDFSEIPVIDLTGVETPDGSERIAAELVDIASRIGFFYVSGHGISPELRAEAIWRAAPSSGSTRRSRRGSPSTAPARLDGAGAGQSGGIENA